MPDISKASTSLLGELETLQDSLLASVLCTSWSGAGHKSMLMQDNKVPHDCKVKNVQPLETPSGTWFRFVLYLRA